MSKEIILTNALIHAQSLYLLQHAYNPVNWVEWSDDIFTLARQQNKLIIVSIGYSACHWCHVMERECFEKEDTAEIMNKHFICVKVDREEHPDVDQIYMDAVQLLTGRGGWPLNVITLPDGRPIHGGTYFPKAEWERVLTSIANLWQTKPEEAMEYATNLSNGIKKLDVLVAEPNAKLSDEIVNDALENWKANFDLQFGGYNWAPKFPMPNNWQLFLQYSLYNSDIVFKDAVNKTLSAMAKGGIYDQLAGGFARYSTDSYWKVPHFEKMLYDNAQLIEIYSLAFAVTANPFYAKTVKQTIEFINKELTNNEGLFFSALDADSENIEGKYYIWNQQELKLILGDDEPIYSLYYSIDIYGNWEHGSNILYITRTDEELEKLTGKPIQQINKIVQTCNSKLLAIRNKRIKPELDDKSICSWNALTIKAFAVAGMVFKNTAYINRAEEAMKKLLEKCFVNNALYRIYKNGKTSINAFAEDYATVIDALIKVYEATGKENYLFKANDLMALSINLFYNPGNKLFYFNNKNERILITKKVDVNDDVIPSANSIFGHTLYKLGFYFNKPEYQQMAEEMILTVQHKIKKFPSGFSNWMQLILLIKKPFYQIVVTGNLSENSYSTIGSAYLPNAMLAWVKEKSSIPLLADKQPTDKTTIYVCVNKACLFPVHTAKEALQQVKF